MPFFSIFINALLGAAAGALIVWLILRSRLAVMQTLLHERTTEAGDLQQTLQQTQQELEGLKDERQQLTVQTGILSSQLSEQQTHSRERLEAQQQHHNQALAEEQRRHAEALAAQQQHHEQTLAAEQQRQQKK